MCDVHVQYFSVAPTIVLWVTYAFPLPNLFLEHDLDKNSRSEELELAALRTDCAVRWVLGSHRAVRKLLRQSIFLKDFSVILGHRKRKTADAMQMRAYGCERFLGAF